MSQFIFPPFPGNPRSGDWIGGHFPGSAPLGSERHGGQAIGYPFLTGDGTLYPLPSMPLAQAFRYWIAPGQWNINFSGTFITDSPIMGWYSPSDIGQPQVPYLNNGAVSITKKVPYGLGWRQTNVDGSYFFTSAYSDAQADGDGLLPRNWLHGIADPYVTVPLNRRMGVSDNVRPPNPSNRSINGLFTDYNDTGFITGLGPEGEYIHFITGDYCYVELLSGHLGLGNGLMFDPTHGDAPYVYVPLFIDAGSYGVSFQPLIADPDGSPGSPYYMIPDPNYVLNHDFACTLDSMPIKMYINWNTGKDKDYAAPSGWSASGSLAITTINAIDVAGDGPP